MRPQTKGTGSADIFSVNALQTPHRKSAELHWREKSNLYHTRSGA